jgi:hypothetical protein
MNELYKTAEPRKSSKRRWIYLICALVVGAGFLLMPQGRTALWDIAVIPGSKNIWSMTIPKDCRLEKLYLRCSTELPQEGKLFELNINGQTFEIADIGKLAAVNVTPIDGYEFKLMPFDWSALAKAETLDISFDAVKANLPENGLFIGVELYGAEDSVKNWRKFIVLRNRDHQTIPMLEVK